MRRRRSIRGDQRLGGREAQEPAELIDERLHAEKPTSLLPWIVGLVVFGGEDPETGCVVESAFQAGFAHTQNLRAWAKVGAVPLTRACLQNSKVRRSKNIVIRVRFIGLVQNEA